jgi:hypothetical protein
MGRTFTALEKKHLRKIRSLALLELERFLTEAGSPPGKYRRYRNRLICIVLAQGAAQHFVDSIRENKFDADVTVSRRKITEKGFRVLRSGRVIGGVKDIDVFFFFRSDARVPIPYRLHCKKTTVARLDGFGERSFDFMKKGLPKAVAGDGHAKSFSSLIQEYLRCTKHGRNYLRRKSIVGLFPNIIFGTQLWRVRRIAESGSETTMAALARPRKSSSR